MEKRTIKILIMVKVKRFVLVAALTLDLAT